MFKCYFLLPEVTYLGFRISKEDLVSLPEVFELLIIIICPIVKYAFKMKAVLIKLQYMAGNIQVNCRELVLVNHPGPFMGHMFLIVVDAYLECES